MFTINGNKLGCLSSNPKPPIVQALILTLTSGKLVTADQPFKKYNKIYADNFF